MNDPPKMVHRSTKILDPDVLKIALKATKGYTSEALDSIVTGDKYDLMAATLDAVSIVAAESMAHVMTPSLEKM